MRIENLPFTILALANFCPIPESGGLKTAQVDLAGLDQAFSTLGPRFYLPMPKEVCPEAGLTIDIKRLKDFKPESLVKNVPYLNHVAEARRFIKDAVANRASLESIISRLQAEWPDLPLDYPVAGAPKPSVSTDVDDILAMVTGPGEGVSSAVRPADLNDLAAQIDNLLAILLNQIFDHPEFRTYEAAWRGLDMLVKQGPVKEGQGVHLEIVPVTMDNLADTLNVLSERLMDSPPNVVLIDLPFDSSTRCTDLLTEVAEFADRCLSPTICWVNSHFLFLDDWTGLSKIPYLKHYLEEAPFAKWRKLKEHDGANWLALALNSFLGRPAYGPENKPQPIYFQEGAPVWLSPVWAVGALLVQSYLAYGWPTRFTDYMNLSLKNLPLAEVKGQGPLSTQMAIDEDRLMEFIEAGLIPLFGPYRKDVAFIPKENTLAGGSLKYQMFTGRVLGFLFWCRTNLAAELGQGDLTVNLKQALAIFWEKTGHPAPKDLSVIAASGAEGEGTVLTVGLTPGGNILPGGQRLEFSFRW